MFYVCQKNNTAASVVLIEYRPMCVTVELIGFFLLVHSACPVQAERFGSLRLVPQ